MKYRILGKTGLKVSEIGMGTWQLAGKPWGWDAPDEDESVRALYKFVELGGNFIDTAWVYGRVDEPGDEEGKRCSEELIGEFLKESGNRGKVIIATKIPGKNRKWPAFKGVPISEVFPAKYIEEMVDSSLQSLGVDAIDIMQFHVWQDYFAEDDDWKTATQKITKAGKVKFWGLSINDYQPTNCFRTIDTGLILTIQFIFNVFHQKPSEKLLPYAKSHNVGLIARVPLDEGGLTGKYTTETTFNDPLHKIYFSPDRLKELVEHTSKLEGLLGSEAKSLPELALRYILSWDEVSTAIPGMRKVKNVEANVAASDGKKLSSALLGELEKHAWERNFYVGKDPSMAGTGYLGL